MAVELATAYVSIVPEMSGVAGKIKKDMGPAAQQAGEESGSTMGGAMAGAASKVAKTGALAVGAGFATAIAKGFNRLQAIDEARFKLQGLGHDADTVETIMGSAMDSVLGTSFGFGDAASIAASAVAAGVKPGEDLTRTLSLTGDAATIAGTSLSDMGSIFGKIGAGNRMMTEEMNQLQDRGLPILSWLQDEYGVTATAAREMVSNGEVDFATFQRLIEDNIGGAALTAGESFKGSLANMGAAIGRFGAALLGPAFERAPAVFANISDKIDGITNSIGPVYEAVSGWLSGFSTDLGTTGGTMQTWRSAAITVFNGVRTVITNVFGWLRQFWATWGADITAFAVTTWNQISSTVSSAVDAISAVIRTVMAGLEAFWRTWGETILAVGRRIFDTLSNVIENSWNSIKMIVSGALDIIQGVFETFAGLFTGDWERMWEGVQQTIDGVWETVEGIVRGVVDNIVDILHGAIASIGRVIGDWVAAITDPLVDLALDLWSTGRDLVRGLWDGISSLGSWLAGKLTSWVADNIPGPIARALGIASPSTVAAALAREVPRGMVVGMSGELSALQAMSERMAMAALPDLAVPTVSRPYSSATVAAPFGDDDGGGRLGWSSPLIGEATFNSELDVESVSRRLARAVAGA